MPSHIRRLTLADDVYEAIKAQVMDHALAPGERVNIDALARELDVSPTPVREALARLESDGLVRKRPMSGYTTTPLLTRAEFEDLFEMRLLLEVRAAERAAHRPARLDELRVAGNPPGPVDATTYIRYAAFTAADVRFHALVGEIAGNPMLHDAITRLHAHLHLHRLYLPDGEMHNTAAEHARVYAAIAAGVPADAAAAMRDHLHAARRRHLAAFGDAGQNDAEAKED